MYRELDRADDARVCAEPGNSVLLETTLCQRVVDGRLPQIFQDAWAEPEMVNLAAVKVIHAKSALEAVGATMRDLAAEIHLFNLYLSDAAENDGWKGLAQD